VTNVNVKINVTPSFCNDWPLFTVLHNNNVVWDGRILHNQILEFNLQCDTNNKLTFKHYGKRFGENNVWDTTKTEDRFLKINDILFDDVSIGDEIKNQLTMHTYTGHGNLQTYGLMNFNGHIDLEFETPVYDWLILSKYKKEVKDAAFFSNYTTRWHYDKDIELIKEIKVLMDLND